MRPTSCLLVPLLVLVGTPVLHAQGGDPGAASMCHNSARRGALASCREAVRLQPDDAALQARLGAALVATGDTAGGVSALERAVALAPDSAAPRFALARLLDARGQRRAALAHYRHYARLTPGEPAGPEIVGWLQLELRDGAGALAAFRDVVDREPASAAGHYGIGLALEQLGRREEAVRALRTAVTVAPANGEAWGTLARLALALGRAQEAVAYWERAVLVDGRYFDARRDERRQWERLVRQVGQQAPASLAMTPVVLAGPAPRTSEGAAVESLPPRRPMPPAGVAPAAPRIRRTGSVFTGGGSTGSGFVVSTAGHVLTNRHVVRSCTAVRVRADGGTSVAARVVALDGDDDLALLRADTTFATAAVFRAGPDPRAGESVVAVGYPLNGLLADQVHVSTGAVNALAGMYNDSHELQMSAPVQPGNSGGPLLDASGRVVGIVVTKLNARLVADATGDLPQNVNFAIKAGIAREFLAEQGVAVASAAPATARSNADVGETGRAVTVLVECARETSAAAR